MSGSRRWWNDTEFAFGSGSFCMIAFGNVNYRTAIRIGITVSFRIVIKIALGNWIRIVVVTENLECGI